MSEQKPELSYEQARAELRDIVQALESGGQPLEESLSLWQRGEELAAICQQWLQGARSRLDDAIAQSEAIAQSDAAELDG
jgi:exodeoxyribonuclease VII small subunit